MANNVNVEEVCNRRRRVLRRFQKIFSKNVEGFWTFLEAIFFYSQFGPSIFGFLYKTYRNQIVKKHPRFSNSRSSKKYITFVYKNIFLCISFVFFAFLCFDVFFDAEKNVDFGGENIREYYGIMILVII